MRERIFEIVEPAKEGDTVSRAYDAFIMTVAIISVIPMTFKPDTLSESQLYAVNMLDIITAMFLLLDYFMRWMTFDLKRKKRGKKGGPASFIGYPFTLSAIINLLAILPTIVPIAASLKFLRLLRLVKIFRSARNLRIIGAVFVNERKTLISVVGIVAIFIFVTGVFMFLVERSSFDTFIDALYWATSALTTIGYGDYYPTSDVGQIINAISSILGIVVLAIPTGIIAAGYVAETARLRKLGVPSHREIDTERTVADRVLDTYNKIVDKRKDWKTREKKHPIANMTPKTKFYAAIMIACTTFSCFATVFQSTTGIYGNIALAGPAVAAFFLEPAAGFFVGFISTLLGCATENNVGNILFLGDTWIAVFSFGIVMSCRKPITRKRLALAYILMIFVLLIIQNGEMALSLWDSNSNGVPWIVQLMFAIVDPNGNIAVDSIAYSILYIVFYLIWQSLLFATLTAVLLRARFHVSTMEDYKDILGIGKPLTDNVCESEMHSDDAPSHETSSNKAVSSDVPIPNTPSDSTQPHGTTSGSSLASRTTSPQEEEVEHSS